ncbi:D-alanyl-D-alanine carboxypeptidase/D-alanyl-D-alanine-endopeptidase [Novosphingobium sp.]|uniref:D-alanyl-D-alanine carboxypeptidase/D-alanyl-D-alanine endopeptidase n=1 Tax=Novosphingobium sp. TaxID=1874826 RepID=UPI00286A546C|nr:D-alanyl-D-alanine carboxypeptidase/D-alanyl-D-alanine-endopeptidase [Novosphingobium sp.]
MITRFAFAALLLLAQPALAQSIVDGPRARPVAAQDGTTQRAVEAVLAEAPKGTRFGLLVVDLQGRVIVSVNPDMRFVPASNTKLFTTAAALALLPRAEWPDAEGGAQVFLMPGTTGKPKDVVLYGRGDARLSSAADCKVDCLAVLADAVAAKTRVVGDVIGDDSYFPDQRWSAGMSWNNIGDYNATAASALSLDANELPVRVIADPAGGPPLIAAPPYLIVRNEALTVNAGAPTTLQLEHRVNSREFRLYGTIAVGAPEWRARVGIDDPADYAATVFARMLRERGVKVLGTVQVRHQPVMGKDLQPAVAAGQAVAVAEWGAPIAAVTPPPLAELIPLINKPSQNHHAELLLRRIGRVNGGSGSVEDGLAAERALFIRAGVPAEGFDLFDGSGMSSYNRASPRAMIALLRWGIRQPWGTAWLASFPVAGRDGTLTKRFAGTPLEGRIQAKTGTLNATNALSGTMTTASGRRLFFAFFANDVPDGASAVPIMEKVLEVVAAAN